MILKLILFYVSAWSAPMTENHSLFKQVIERRSEMEELSREVRALQESLALRKQQSEVQFLDLESQIHQLVLKKSQLIEKKSALKASLQLHAPESQDSRQIVKKWFRILHESIDGSLPFAMSERKKKVLELEKRWQDGEPTITTLWSLWTLSHEELGLTRGVHYSLLKDNATEKEKEVVRLGMWRMYERDVNNYTLIEMKNQKWVRNPISKADDRASAEKLFEASQTKNFQRILFLPQGDSK
jgi:hypothetical protein